MIQAPQAKGACLELENESSEVPKDKTEFSTPADHYVYEPTQPRVLYHISKRF